MFNDVGACLLEGLTTPVTQPNDDDGGQQPPPSTPDPAELAAQARAAIDRAATRVSAAIADLGTAQGGPSGVIAQTTNDLDAMQSDLGNVATAKDAVAAEAGPVDAGTVCADAGGVAADAGGVEADLGGIEADGGALEAEFGALDASIQTLTDRVTDLRHARSALPSYQPASAPSDADVADALQSAASARLTAQSQYVQLLSTAEGYVAQAQALADEAQAICDSV